MGKLSVGNPDPWIPRRRKGGVGCEKELGILVLLPTEKNFRHAKLKVAR